MKKQEQLRLGLGLALLLAVAACASNEGALKEKGLQPLSSDQIKALFSKPQTMDWQASNGRSGTSQFQPDGTVSVQVGANFNDTGRYWINDSGWCSQYQRIRQGQQACFRVYQTGPNAWSTVTDKGEADVTFRLR